MMIDQTFGAAKRTDAFPPACVQPNATQAATLVGCGAIDWNCACNNYEFLAIFQPVILEQCGSNALEVLASAQQYCTAYNPALLDSRAVQYLPPSMIATALSIVAVALRFHARRVSKTVLGADDWLAVCALVCACVISILQPVGLTWDEGRHSFMVGPQQSKRSNRSALVSLWMVTVSLICIKDSICALYLRIFGHIDSFRRVIIVTGIAVPVIQLTTIFLFTFACHPIAYFWDKAIAGGTCWNAQQVIVGLAAADLATGVWVMLLPVPILLRLHATRSHKILLILVFFMGSFACVSAAMRIPFVLTIDIYDTSWSSVPFTIWSVIELHVGIMSICLPAMRPLLGHWGRLLGITNTLNSQPTPNDSSKIYTGGESRGTTGAWTSTQKSRANDQQWNLGSRKSEDDTWPLSSIGVTKEVDVSNDKDGVLEHAEERLA